MEIHFVEASAIHGRTLYVEGSEARHIVKVLRHDTGDTLTFTDGCGNFLEATIDRCDASAVHAEIGAIRPDPREAGAPWSTLGLALLKGAHFEMAIEKAVELGVHRIVPLQADHCVVRIKDRSAAKKLERWQRIADSAMKQSGRSWRCELLPPLPVVEAVRQYAGDAVLIVADETETGTETGGGDQGPGLQPGQPHFGLVGPEGAFSEREKQWLQEQGARAVSLGPFRLRAETAAIVLAAVLNQGRKHG